MHEVLVNRLGGLSLPRKSVVRLTDRPDMTLDVYRGRKTSKQQQQQLVRTTYRSIKMLNEVSCVCSEVCKSIGRHCRSFRVKNSVKIHTFGHEINNK